MYTAVSCLRRVLVSGRTQSRHRSSASEASRPHWRLPRTTESCSPKSEVSSGSDGGNVELILVWNGTDELVRKPRFAEPIPHILELPVKIVHVARDPAQALSELLGKCGERTPDFLLPMLAWQCHVISWASTGRDSGNWLTVCFEACATRRMLRLVGVSWSTLDGHSGKKQLAFLESLASPERGLLRRCATVCDAGHPAGRGDHV